MGCFPTSIKFQRPLYLNKSCGRYKDSFGMIFQEINNLIVVGEITINDSKLNLEFFLGGDYKLLLIMMDMKAATSNFACVWCKIHKDNRWEMDKDLDYYNSVPKKRLLQEVINMALKKRAQDKFSCDHKPLINIDLDHVVLDELHLLVRVMDVLLNNTIQEVISWDQKENFNKKKSEKRNTNLTKLLTFGKRKMKMGGDLGNMTSQAFLVQTRRSYWLHFQTNLQIV